MSKSKEKEEKEENEEEVESDEEEEDFNEEIKLPKIGGVNFNIDKLLENKLLNKTEKSELYTNLYPIEFTKDIEIYQYEFQIKPECHEESVILKILREKSPDLFKAYGYYYRSGNNIFALKKIEEERIFKALIVYKGWLEYKIIFKPYSIGTIIKKGKTHDFTEIQEKMLFLVIREILSANPNVHFDRDNLYLENKKETVKGEINTYFIHDGYKISIQQASIGICLIIGVKNKIKGKLTVLDFINASLSNGYEEEIDKLSGRRFIPYEGSRSQVISYIDFDRNPINTIRNYRQITYNYVDYYDKIWKIKINDKKQPLIIVDIKDPQYKEKPKCYVPELFYLLGINEEDTQNFYFMKKIIEKTRLNPDQKIEQIQKCILLFVNTTERKSVNNSQKGENLNTIYDDENNTSKKKLKHYGIKINKLNDPIKPYYLEQPTFNNGINNNLTIKDISKVIPVVRENISTDDWICLYSVQAEKISFKLLEGFLKCCRGYHIKFKNNDSNWILMKSQNAKDWIYKVENELVQRKNCKFVLFLINNKTNHLYKPLKKHSLCTKGYISQIIKYESIVKSMKGNKGPDSYFSKILLQINNKLGGFNYFLNINENIKSKNIILRNRC